MIPMIKAIFLDLDNTLLHNPDMIFARAFLEHFEAYFSAAGIADADINLRRAIKAMSNNQRGDVTNRELLISFLGDDRTIVEEVFNSFYADVYPSLQGCIKAVEGASDLILSLSEMGFHLVIATNPIYPETAVKQRMAWAGLPLDDDIFDLLTSADNMHFAKPDAAYYAEILGRIGLEPDEAIMLGDSQGNDIYPAQLLGIHTYYLGEKPLSSFMEHLKILRKDTPPLALHPDMIEPQLRGNMGALYGLLAKVKSNFWHQHPDSKEWSIIQILCHLLTSEDTIERPRLERILKEENPFITQAKPPGLNIEVCAEEGYSVARELLETRQKTIEFAEMFSADDWNRPARHSIFGLTTMLEMAYFTAQHDRLHLKQLCQTIGGCE
jgi:FMN phosphatase YigB (HAD superfamily)